MATNRIVIEGIEDFRRLPGELQDAGRRLVVEGATDAKDQIRSAYPRETGELAGGVTVTHGTFQGGALSTVRSTARYAHIYEFGSKHQRGRPTFYPIADREQDATRKALIEIVRAAGFTVTGDDA